MEFGPAHTAPGTRGGEGERRVARVGVVQQIVAIRATNCARFCLQMNAMRTGRLSWAIRGLAVHRAESQLSQELATKELNAQLQAQLHSHCESLEASRTELASAEARQQALELSLVALRQAEDEAKAEAAAGAQSSEASLQRQRAADEEAKTTRRDTKAKNEACRQRNAKLENRLAQEEQWRAKAEREIISMVSRGEALERERAQHAQRRQELQQATHAAVASALSQPLGFSGCTPKLEAVSLRSGEVKVTSPQLEEFDAYEELVERLQAELQWERTERESLDSNVATLRSSYQLLLERLQGSMAPTGDPANCLT